MKLLFVIFTFFTHPSWALKVHKVSRVEYARYIVPQFKSIISEYHSVVQEIQPEAKRAKVLINSLDKITSIFQILELKCPARINQGCLPQLKSIKEKLIKTEKMTFEFISEINPKKDESSLFFMTNKNIKDILKSIYSLQSFLEKTEIELKFNIKSNQQSPNLKKQLDQLQYLFHRTYIDHLPEIYRDVFWKAHSDFILPVSKNYMSSLQIPLFKRNIEQLNFTWNEFINILTKKIQQTPERSKRLLKTMHRRWSAILKVALR